MWTLVWPTLLNSKNNAFAGNTGHFDDEIDFAGSEGLAGMKVGAPRGQTDGGIAHNVTVHTQDTCCKTGVYHEERFVLSTCKRVSPFKRAASRLARGTGISHTSVSKTLSRRGGTRSREAVPSPWSNHLGCEGQS